MGPLESCRAIKFLLAALSLTRSRVVSASGMFIEKKLGEVRSFVIFMMPEQNYNLKIFSGLRSFVLEKIQKKNKFFEEDTRI